MGITVGTIHYINAEWDSDAEFLRVGETTLVCDETPEGHLLELDPDTLKRVGVTFVYPDAQIGRDGGVFITLPDEGRVRVADAEAALAALRS